jgi:hypothetical protein
VRTSLRPKFPANREKYREIREFKAVAASAALSCLGIPASLAEFPCAIEQGILGEKTGKLLPRTGKSFGFKCPLPRTRSASAIRVAILATTLRRSMSALLSKDGVIGRQLVDS